MSPNIANWTLEQAVEALAKRAADLRTRPATAVERSLVKSADMLSGLSHPIVQQALLGSALGAVGTGGVTAAMNVGREKEDRRSVLRSALTGGLAGGALGGGVGLARHGFSNMGKADTGATGAGVPFMYKGKKVMLSPAALKAQGPDFHEKIKDLAAGPSILEGGAQLGIDAAKAPFKAWPWATGIAGGTAAIDLASHLSGAAERVGFGRVNPRHSVDPEHFRAGLQHMVGKDALSGMPKELISKILTTPGEVERLARDPLLPHVPGKPGVLRRGQTGPPAPGPSKPWRWWNPTHWGQQTIDPPSYMGNVNVDTVTKETTHTPERSTERNVTTSKPAFQELTAEQQRLARQKGWHLTEVDTLKQPQPRTQYRIRGKQVPGGGMTGRLLRRAAIYGIPLAAFGAYQLANQPAQRQRMLAETLQELNEAGGLQEVK